MFYRLVFIIFSIQSKCGLSYRKIGKIIFVTVLMFTGPCFCYQRLLTKFDNWRTKQNLTSWFTCHSPVKIHSNEQKKIITSVYIHLGWFVLLTWISGGMCSNLFQACPPPKFSHRIFFVVRILKSKNQLLSTIESQGNNFWLKIESTFWNVCVHVNMLCVLL